MSTARPSRQLDAPRNSASTSCSPPIIRALLDGRTVDHDGEHYRVDRAHVDRSTQDRLPMLVGGNGEALLTHAGARFDDVELNALVQVVQITNDREAALSKICERVDGLSLEDAAMTPYLLVGTVDEIVSHMITCNERWGINYFAVRELDDFEPVLNALGR